MSINNEIVSFLKNQGADFVEFIDIRNLSSKQNQGYKRNNLE